MNIVALTGNLTKDIELRYSASGVAFTSFTLAVRQEFKTNGEYKSDFITCKAFNKTAEILANHAAKGSKIGVRGSIRTGSYEGQDGKRVYTTDVNVDSVEFLSSKKETEQVNTYVAEDPFASTPIEVDNSDLPF